MKKGVSLFFLFSLLSLIWFSCSKDKNEPESLVAKLLHIPNLNAEALRIANDVQDPDMTFGIIQSTYFGEYSTTPESAIFLSGKTSTDVEITINGDSYNPVREDGTWWQTNPAFQSYYGDTVSISISRNGEELNFERYIPYPALAPQLLLLDNGKINREGNTLTWNVDTLNQTEKVAIYYNLFSELSSSVAAYKVDVEVFDNSGSFNIDHIISDEKCKRIEFKVIMGNTLTFNDEGEKVLFHISNYDRHSYQISD